MKRLLNLLALLAACHTGHGQRTEFTVYPNGLIYSEATMNRLEIIVDSLNLKFRSCDLSTDYLSLPQGNGTYVTLRRKSNAAAADICQGISLAAFLKKYPHATAEPLWIVKYRYRTYDDEAVIAYSGLPHGYGAEPSLVVEATAANDITSGWVLGDYETFTAMFVEKLESRALLHDYGRLVQYVDCMVDTTARIFLPGAKRRGGRFAAHLAHENPKADEFVRWANDFPQQPELPEYANHTLKEYDSLCDVYEIKHRAWDSLRLMDLDQRMRQSTQHQALLTEACQQAIDSATSSEDLEFYAARYLTKELTLQLKRTRRVMGMCSQDQSPRHHAVSICQLAAETAKWDIFLRSHLDVMNDRFERVSDGSYAWARRKTYLKELEELDIAAIDLLLGMAFSVQNASDNHYYGSIDRMGRALADAEDKLALEERLLGMIGNEQLDLYNRFRFAYLFSNYTHNLDEPGKTANFKKLDDAIQALPALAQSAWKKNDHE